jgi:hypothetical protein
MDTDNFFGVDSLIKLLTKSVQKFQRSGWMDGWMDGWTKMPPPPNYALILCISCKKHNYLKECS